MIFQETMKKKNVFDWLTEDEWGKTTLCFACTILAIVLAIWTLREFDSKIFSLSAILVALINFVRFLIEILRIFLKSMRKFWESTEPDKK